MNLVAGNTYTVTVIRIESFGAVVELEDKTTSLIHISNIADRFVKSVGDYLSVGDTYEATAIEGKVKPIELTLAPLGLKPKSFKKLDIPEYRPHEQRSYGSKRRGR